MRSILSFLLLAFSFSVFAQTKVMRFADSEKSSSYIEVRQRRQLGSDLISFRLCHKKLQPCDEIPLGDYDWYSQQQMTTLLAGKNIGLFTLEVGSVLGSHSAEVSKNQLSHKIEILKQAFFKNDEKVKNMKVLDFARELDQALKDW